MMVDPAEESGGSERGRSGVWQTLAVGVLVIIVVLIFLILWDPFRGDRRVDDSGRRPGLVGSIDALPASGEYVALWLKPGNDVAAVLGRHGLNAEQILFERQDEGYYVVDIGDGDAEKIVAAMKGDAALYDAGRVYEEPGSP